MRFRCSKTANKQSCRAKANIELLEQNILDDFKDIEAILNPDNWRIREHPHTVHSCDSPVMSFQSDRQNFGNGYRKLKIEMNDSNGSSAWKLSINNFASGLGWEFDGSVCGRMKDHQNKVYYAKKKAQPCNDHIRSAKELQIDDDHSNLEFSVVDQDTGLPIKSIEKWYRNYDQFGNHYFMTRKDSQRLYEANEIYVDGTFRPVAGVKRMFPQLYIFFVRKVLSNKSIIAIPCAFVYTTAMSEKNDVEIR